MSFSQFCSLCELIKSRLLIKNTEFIRSRASAALVALTIILLTTSSHAFLERAGKCGNSVNTSYRTAYLRSAIKLKRVEGATVIDGRWSKNVLFLNEENESKLYSTL